MGRALALAACVLSIALAGCGGPPQPSPREALISREIEWQESKSRYWRDSISAAASEVGARYAIGEYERSQRVLDALGMGAETAETLDVPKEWRASIDAARKRAGLKPLWP